jgi:hypothetical protein
MAGISAARVHATSLVWFSISLQPSPQGYQRWIAPLAPSYSSTSRLAASVTNTVVVPLTVLLLRRPGHHRRRGSHIGPKAPDGGTAAAIAALGVADIGETIVEIVAVIHCHRGRWRGLGLQPVQHVVGEADGAHLTAPHPRFALGITVNGPLNLYGNFAKAFELKALFTAIPRRCLAI